MMDDDVQKRHVLAWGRAAQATGRYYKLRYQGCDTDDPEVMAARETLLAAMVTLIDLSQELDNRGLVWTRGNIYMNGPKSMLASCGMSMQEIEDYRDRHSCP